MNIFNILESMCFGPHYFKVALLLRETMLISSATYNADIWYNLDKNEINELNKIDKHFFSRLLKLPITASCASYYLEFGTMDFGMYIKEKRIMYFFNLVNRNKKHLVYIFFMTQYHQRTSGDWVSQTLQDFKDINMDSSFKFLLNVSYKPFKFP